MAITVEATTQYAKAPAGQYQAVCAEVLELGMVERTYKNRETGQPETVSRNEIQYVFQLNKVDEESGKRFEIRSQPLNLILSEKASLRKFLMQWRGHDLTESELKPPGVDVDLTGRNCLIQVVHNSVGDKTYANIGSIMPLMEGMQPVNVEDYISRQEYVDRKANENAADQQNNQVQPVQSEIAVQDIPF